MKDAIVGGRFVRDNGDPVVGRVKFSPSKIWLDDEDGKTYPCLAPEVDLVDGRFSVALTRTDTYKYPWYYKVETPIGTYSIWIEHDGPMNLKDLLPKTAT
jgi:hypothetical protein